MLNKAGHVVIFDTIILSRDPSILSLLTKYLLYYNYWKFTSALLYFPYRHLMHQEGKTLRLQKVWYRKKYFIAYDVFFYFFFQIFIYDQHLPLRLFRQLCFLDLSNQ